MSRFPYRCCIAVIACGIGLFHMARASSRLTSVHVNTSQNNSGCDVSQRVYRPAGRSHMLKQRICVHSRRSQWIVIDCKRNLQQDKRYCTKKCRCTSYKSPRILKSGVHLFASLENTTCRHCSILRSSMSWRPIRVSPYLFAAHLRSSQVLSDFQIWCSPGCQMHLDEVTMKTCSQSLSASLP